MKKDRGEPDKLDEWLLKTQASQSIETRALKVDPDLLVMNLALETEDKISLVLNIKLFGKTIDDEKLLQNIRALHRKYLDFFMIIIEWGLEKCSGNYKQIEIAGKLGGLHLSQLYDLASGFGYVEELGWTKISVQYQKVKEFQKLVLSNGTVKDDYRGNKGQVRCAKELGGMNFAILYSLATGLGFLKDLGWANMGVPYEKAREFQDLVLDNETLREEYKGNKGQARCAKELGKMNLGNLYSLAAGLDYAEKLGWTRMNIPYQKVKEFQDLVLDDKTLKDEYKGNRGQIRCAKELGEMNLSHLHDLSSAFEYAKELGWTEISVPYKKVAEFEELVLASGTIKDEYKGNSGQIRCAKELGEMHLSQLYSLATGFECVEELGWTKISVQYQKVKEFQKLVLSNGTVKDYYRGNNGQVRCAKELGEMHLNQLYSLASGLGYAENLTWTSMCIPYKKVKEFQDLVMDSETVKDEYKGNDGQIRCAKKLGEMHLAHLYGLASGLGYAEELGWNAMYVAYKKAAAFQKLVLDNGTLKDEYKGNRGQIRCAKELGEMNLGYSYALASCLGYVEELGWTDMIVPYGKIKEFQDLVMDSETVKDEYKGNEGQIRCAKKLGEMHLSHVYSLASGLGYLKKLGWYRMNTPYQKVKEFQSLVMDNATVKDEYKGNRGQIRCAKELGEMYLGGLYVLAAGLGCVEELNWTVMNVPYKKVAEFEELVLVSGTIKDEYKGNRGQIRCAKELGEMNLGNLYTLVSGLDYGEKFGWTSLPSPYRRVMEFEELVLDNGKIKDEYKGNKGQIRCAKELGEIYLYHLCSLASGLGYAEELGWNNMKVPYKKSQEFVNLIAKTIKSGNIDDYEYRAGRLNFAMQHGYNFSALLTLAEVYDFEIILSWRLKSKSVRLNSRSVYSYETAHTGDGRALQEVLGDDSSLKMEEAIEEQQLLVLCKRIRECPDDINLKEVLMDLLDLDEKKFERFKSRLLQMTNEEVETIFA